MYLKDFLRTVALVRRLEAGPRQALLRMANQHMASQRMANQRTVSHRMVNLRTTNRNQRLQLDVKQNAVSRMDSLRVFKNLVLLYKSLYPKRREHNLHLPPPPPMQPPAPAQPAQPVYRAIYDFQGQTASELSFAKGEILDITKKEGNGMQSLVLC